jgi:integrase
MGMVYRPKYRSQKTGQYLQSAIWWIKYYRDGKAIRESSESEKEKDAKNLLKQREGDVIRGVPIVPRANRIRFEEMIADLEIDYDVNKKRSAEDLKRRLKLHLIPFFGNHRASSITTADVNRYIQSRQVEGAANASINRELAALKRAFSLAVQGGKLMHRPHIPMLKENNVRTGFFEGDQFETVRRHLPDEIQPIVTFAYITGWRTRSEVLPLQWPQVDFQAGIVRLDPGTTKNSEGRVFPFTQELRALLEAQRAKADALKRDRGLISPWVFNRHGKKIKTFRGAWASACKSAGLPGRIPHDFRRTAVRNLVRAGIPERVAMTMTGHKTRSVFERYNIVSGGDLMEAAKKLDEVRRLRIAAEDKGQLVTENCSSMLRAK